MPWIPFVGGPMNGKRVHRPTGAVRNVVIPGWPDDTVYSTRRLRTADDEPMHVLVLEGQPLCQKYLAKNRLSPEQ